jgi:Putative zinc-finger/WD40-like Beta Propeller Repeat
MNFRHNDPQTPHERARALASDRLDGSLAAADALWLDDHLATCDACRAVAVDFAANRELLRALPVPEPPRDLWARTSVALDRERSSIPVPLPAARNPWIRREALVGIAAVVIVGILAGRSLLPSGGAEVGLGSPAPQPTGGATPLAVAPGNVGWAAPGADGRYTVNLAEVDSVCPGDAATSPACAPLDAGAQAVVSLSSRPASIILAPQAEQAAVVESSASTTGGSILVVPIDRSRPAPTPSQTPAASNPASAAPAASPSSTPGKSAGTSPAPTVSASPEGSPSPSASAEPTATPEPTATAGSTASPSAAPIPTGTPAPTAAATLAIIKDVIVVGGDASYSPDGEWLAFSARPADGSAGPDVYVWHVGDESARPITSDHATIFSDWADGRILASRAGNAKSTGDEGASPLPASSGDVGAPVSVILDPMTGKQHGGRLAGVWRPVVDPDGRWVVYWTGSLEFDAGALSWLPAEGDLVIAGWDDVVNGKGSPSDAQPLGVDGVREWEARWDPTGRYLGLWTADPAAPGLGRLNLLPIDRSTGRVDDSSKRLLKDAPALAGFAISDGRIAWATPPGQDGEGSRLSVLAWKGPDAGRTRSEPAPSDIVVVR